MCYLTQLTSLVFLVLINGEVGGDCPPENNDLVLDPPVLIVRFGDPVSVRCHSLSNYTDLYWSVSDSYNRTETWETNSLTDYEIQPLCHMTLDNATDCNRTLPIIVYKPPDQVSITIVDHTGPVDEGRMYELQCDIQNVAPVHLLNVTWYKGPNLIKNINFTEISTKIPMSKSSRLQILPGRGDHGVQYRCEANLSLGAEGPQQSYTESGTLNINLSYRPEIKLDNQQKSVKEGEDVSLICTAEGNPEPEVRWSFQNQTKTTGWRQKTLNITKASSADAGEYTCTATNYLGKDTRNLSLTISKDCQIKLQPAKLVVEYGAPASAVCSTTTTHYGLGWEASQGAVDMVEDVQSITWRVENLTHWDIQPICFMNREHGQCELNLPLTIYKRPDQVSISTVTHIGPMIEDRQYELQCDVQNVAPAHFLTVNWYKGQELVKSVTFEHISSRLPQNISSTLRISTSKDDDGVQYRCEAELKLGPEGPQPPPLVSSDPLNITVHYKPIINCLDWSPMINTSLNSYPYKLMGNPSPAITWHRDKSLVSPDMRLGMNDSGQYNYTASNTMGNTSCLTQITVEYAPTFECPVNYTESENDSFSNKCSVRASPAANIIWEKDGIIVNPLHTLTRGDTGSYVITAENKHGLKKHNLIINVLYKPIINCSSWSPMINTSLNSYPYKLMGNPSPAITWHRDKSLVSPDMRLGMNDSGQYNYTASNTMGNTSCLTQITVEYAPTFECPVNYTESENDSFSNKCSVRASPAANIIWEKDGIIVNPLHTLTRGDTGSYVITAENKHGLKKHNLIINVLYKPIINCSSWSPMINTSLNSYPYKLMGNPSPAITWHRDKSLVSPDMRLGMNDSGQYNYTASNTMGNTSCLTQITVEYAPTFECPVNYTESENDSFSNKCSVRASPAANIIWEKDGIIVNPLHTLTRGDTGSYVITAENKHGLKKHNLIINVLYRPEIKLDNQQKSVKEGEDVSLICTAEGNPEPEVRWSFQNQTKTTGWRQKTLNITKASSADAGEYTCTATNYLGKDTRNLSLTISKSYFPIILIICLVLSLVIGIIICIWCVWMKRKRSGKYNIEGNGALNMSLLKQSDGKGVPANTENTS